SGSIVIGTNQVLGSGSTVHLDSVVAIVQVAILAQVDVVVSNESGNTIVSESLEAVDHFVLNQYAVPITRIASGSSLVVLQSIEGILVNGILFGNLGIEVNSGGSSSVFI